MARWLKALTALTERLGSIPSNYNSKSQLPVTPVSGDLVPSSGPHQFLHADGAYKFMHTHLQIHIKERKKTKKNPRDRNPCQMTFLAWLTPIKVSYWNGDSDCNTLQPRPLQKCRTHSQLQSAASPSPTACTWRLSTDHFGS